MTNTPRKTVEVAAAVMVREDGCYLLGQRGAGSFYPGYWEFPGGKVEPNEQPHQALIRELHEELNIAADAPEPWLVREHSYEHAYVRLHFYRVRRWRGRIVPKVHAALHWQDPHAAAPEPMLPANGPILRALTLPAQIGITHTAAYGTDGQLERIRAALVRGSLHIHLREPALPLPELRAFATAVRALAPAPHARVLLHVRPDQTPAQAAALAAELALDGVHLPAAALASTDERPNTPWCSAAAHTRDDLRRAATLGCDYAFLSPVLATASHPHTTPLGWGGFAALAAGFPMPVYALGGLTATDLPRARAAGAHGIAAIRSAWFAES